MSQSPNPFEFLRPVEMLKRSVAALLGGGAFLGRDSKGETSSAGGLNSAGPEYWLVTNACGGWSHRAFALLIAAACGAFRRRGR